MRPFCILQGSVHAATSAAGHSAFLELASEGV